LAAEAAKVEVVEVAEKITGTIPRSDSLTQKSENKTSSWKDTTMNSISYQRVRSENNSGKHFVENFQTLSDFVAAKGTLKEISFDVGDDS
jgi:hypothetical protein